MAAAAPSPLVSSIEKTNGAKLSRLLIDGGTTVLRKIFDGHHHPANLITDLNANYPILSNLLRRRVLNGHQWDKLFPPGGVPPDSNTFDITLLFLLLTKICELTPPPSGWHTKPPSSDTSHEANLARVKVYRNILYGHVTTTGVDTPTFSALWTEISDVLVSLGLDQAEVDRLKAEKGGEQDYIDVLTEWADSEEDIKTQLRNIHQSQSQTHQAVQDVRLAQEKTQKTVKEIRQSQDKTQRRVEDIHQTQAKTQKRVEDMHHIHTQTQQRVKEVNQNVREVVTGLKEIKEAVYSLKEGKDKDSSDEVLRNLTKSEFSGDIEYYVQRFQEGTREWVFDRVQNWLDDRSSQNRVMVIKGDTGTGKSVIAAVICKRMQEAGRLSGSHFCHYNKVRYCKPQLMIQSLACHFSHALPEYKQALVKQLSRNMGTDLNNMGVEELFALLFKEPLGAVGDPGRNMLMVIDGLDESEYQGRNELLDVIANQFCKLPIWFRFLVTTRPALNIAEKLKHLKSLELKSNDEENLEDVRVLFLKRLELLVKHENVKEFTEQLLLKSEGLISYAYFLILAITENASILHEGDLVGSLPLGISSVYLSYFKRLERELINELNIGEEHFLNLLSAIAASREPLPVKFVSKVLVPATDSLLARRKVVRALSSVSALLPIRDDCLHVIHKSVKDWLTDITCYGKHVFTVDENEGHRLLADFCTVELEKLKLFKGFDTLQFDATERYAFYHGAHHMLQDGVEREPHQLNELTKAYVIDLEIVYAKTCVNSAIATEDLLQLKNQGIFTLLSKDNQSIVDTLLFLFRKNLRLLTDTPRTFLQTILNQGGKVLTVEALNLLRNKYPEIPYMEVVHKETQQEGVVARFKCSSDVICLDVSPQLDYMVCECEDKMLQLWSLQTGRLVWTRPVVVEKRIKRSWLYIGCRKLPSADTLSLFRSVVFHPKKAYILPGILSQAYTMDGELKPLFPGSDCRFSVCSISGNKTKILTNCFESSKCLVLWSLENGSEVDRILANEDILSFAWSGDGRLLAISHSSGLISLYDVMGNFRKLTQMTATEVCGMVKFSPDHRFIFCCALKGQFQHSLFCLEVVKEANNTFSLTDVLYNFENLYYFNDCGFLFGDLVAMERYQFQWTFCLDKQRLLLSSKSSIEMVDAKYVTRNDQGVATAANGIVLSLDGQTVFVASETSVTAYDVSSGKRKAEINCWRILYRPLCPVRGGVLILTNESTVELWSGNLTKGIKRWTNLREVKQLISISDERVVVVGEVDVKVLDISSGKVVSAIPGLQGRVLTCNSNCQLLIKRTLFEAIHHFSCSLQLLDGTTVVWGREGIFGNFGDEAVVFSPMAQFLVVGTNVGTLVLDAETGITLRVLGPSFPLLRHCTFVSDDTCVISDSNLTVLLNVKSGELLAEFDVEVNVTCLAACPFNGVLAIGLKSSTPNFKVIRVHLPPSEDRGNGKSSPSGTTLYEEETLDAPEQDLREKKQPRATLKLKEKKPLFEPPISHLDAGEEKDATEMEAEGNVEAVSAQGTEVELQGVPTEESDAVGVAVEEDKGTGSHGGSDEQVDVESAVNETETESEDDVEEEKEDVEAHEQVAELAAVETIGGFLEGSEEEIEGDSVNESDSSGHDAGGQNVTDEQSGRIVTSKGTDWANKTLGVHLMFPPDAVSEPTPLMVHRWKYSVCSPPLLEHEAITSNVIELSSMDCQSVKFNTKVKLSLSHSATNLRGYELVIKKLIDKHTNKWEEVDETKDIRSLEEIKDDVPSHVEIPDLFFPVAQADITECSTYAVVCRLKPSPTYTITSKGGLFSHPDYPGVTVTIPENAVAPNAEFPLELQVQEVSNEEFKGEGVFLGPVLRINCSEGVQFLKPVTIQLPISLREQEDLNLSPICGSTCDVKVLFLKSDDKQKTWIEITDDLVNPPSLDGKFVRFEVERFSRYSHFVKRRKKIARFYRQRVIYRLNSSISVQPRLAVFFAYFRPDLPTILRLMCCSAHLQGKQIKKLKKEGIRPVYCNSKKDLTPGYDKAFVSVSGGICLHEEDMERIYLRFLEHNPDDAELEVDFCAGENVARVKFYNTLKHREPPLCRLHLKTPTQGTDSSDMWELARQPVAVLEGSPTNNVLQHLSKKISNDWRRLGRRLSFDEADLQEFDDRRHEISEKAYAMLLRWKQRKGSDATYSVLNNALRDRLVDRTDLAQEFCCLTRKLGF